MDYFAGIAKEIEEAQPLFPEKFPGIWQDPRRNKIADFRNHGGDRKSSASRQIPLKYLNRKFRRSYPFSLCGIKDEDYAPRPFRHELRWELWQLS